MNQLLRSCVVLLCVLAGTTAHVAAAAPGAVEAFDAATWQSLQATLERPAVVVFTATYCANCPAVIDGLVRDVRRHKLAAEVMAVVIDVAPGDNDAALRRNSHYRQADRLFAFAGQAAAVRHAVDPRWRGVTPYVVFLAPNAPAMAVTGAPSRADLDTWLRASGAAVRGR